MRCQVVSVLIRNKAKDFFNLIVVYIFYLGKTGSSRSEFGKKGFSSVWPILVLVELINSRRKRFYG